MEEKEATLDAETPPNLDIADPASLVESVSNFDILPLEITIKILRLLRLIDRKNATLVCQEWHEILNLPTIMEDVNLNIEHCYMRKGFPPIRDFLKVDRPFPNVVIASLRWKYWSSAYKFFKKVGRDTKALTLLSSTDQAIYTAILKNFPKLEKLTLGDIDILWLIQRDTKPKALKELRVMKAENTIKPDFCRILDKFASNLESISVAKMFIPRRSANQSKSTKTSFFQLDDDVHNAFYTLWDTEYFGATVRSRSEKLTFADLEYVIIRKQPTIELELCHKLKDLGLVIKRETGCFFMHDKLELPSIKRIHISRLLSFGSVLPAFCMDCLDFLLESCPNVNNWFLDVPAEALKIVLVTTNKLKHLKALVNSSENVTVSEILHAIKDFSQLQSLELINITNFDVSEWPKMPVLTHLICSFNAPSKLIVPFDIIAENCPEIEVFGCSSRLSPNEPEIKYSQLVQILKGWRYMRSLDIALSKLCLLKDAVAALEQYGKGIKVLKLRVKNVAEPKLKSLCYNFYAKLPGLRSIQINDMIQPLTYAQYWEARLKSRTGETTPVRTLTSVMKNLEFNCHFCNVFGTTDDSSNDDSSSDEDDDNENENDDAVPDVQNVQVANVEEQNDSDHDSDWDDVSDGDDDDDLPDNLGILFGLFHGNHFMQQAAARAANRRNNRRAANRNIVNNDNDEVN